MNPISPSKLRSDLYNFSYDEGDTTTTTTLMPPSVIAVLSSILERTIARNERSEVVSYGADLVEEEFSASRARDNFHSRQVLNVSIQAFLERMFRYARVAPPVYVVAYVYMDRLCRLNPGLRICSTNVHRLLVVTVMVASKFVEDMNYRNSYFAKVGGISATELNGLELQFLFLMKFKLHVSVSVFESYCRHLEREVSFGGGYQIERSLRLMCGGEITATNRQRREREHGQVVARVL